MGNKADTFSITFVRRRKYVYMYMSRTFRGKTIEFCLGRDLKGNQKAFAKKMLLDFVSEIKPTKPSNVIPFPLKRSN